MESLTTVKKVELVFRTVGERTSELALDLALKNVAPDKVHVIENVRPFSQAVQQALAIDYDSDFVVFVDADCLILEDMRPFLEENARPYVDSYVLDKFRQRVHAGVHITRIDVIRAMSRIKASAGDKRYVLKPESRTRDLALWELDEVKTFRRFRILHDFFQHYHDIFAKYVLRGLRSWKHDNRIKLDLTMKGWEDDDLDFLVARRAVDYARNRIGLAHSAVALAEFIADLPIVARRQVEEMGIQEKAPLTLQEVLDFAASPSVNERFEHRPVKVFGIGLSRTGTKSLTKALDWLGFNVIHYPVGKEIFEELTKGIHSFSLLQGYDGITDITVAPFYAQLDKLYPGSKFILTVRDKESWLRSLEQHWKDKPAFGDRPGRETKMKIRRFLRAAVYGCYAFNRDRMSYVYDLHYKNVVGYFRGRPESLLILDIVAGEGWEKLCPFLNVPMPDVPFPDVNEPTT